MHKPLCDRANFGDKSHVGLSLELLNQEQTADVKRREPEDTRDKVEYWLCMQCNHERGTKDTILFHIRNDHKTTGELAEGRDYFWDFSRVRWFRRPVIFGEQPEGTEAQMTEKI